MLRTHCTSIRTSCQAPELGNFDDPATEMSLLYRTCDNGYFSTRVDGRQWGYPLSQVAQVGKALSGRLDASVSQNLFRNPFRRLVNLSSLTSLYLDCDPSKCERRWDNPDELCQAILLNLEEQGLPMPSYVVGSGRGCHLKWLFDASMPVEAYSRWHRAQRELCAKLTRFGADPAALDGARLLRACGTINSRNDAQARIIFADQFGNDVRRFDADQLLDAVLPLPRAVLRQAKRERQEKTQNADRHGTASNLMSPAERSLLALSDLRKLIQIRGWGCIEDGSEARNNWLHIGVSAASWGFGLNSATLEPEAIALWQEFCPTLPETEVRAIIASVQDYGSRVNSRPFRTDTIVEQLGISDAEQVLLKHLRHSSLRLEVKRVRRKAYDALRNQAESNRTEYEQIARERRLEVVLLRGQGMTFRQIAKALGGTIRGVESLMRQARKKGELPSVETSAI